MKNKCKRCGYEWESNISNPVSCPNCKRYDWNREKQTIKRKLSIPSIREYFLKKQNWKCDTCGKEIKSGPVEKIKIGEETFEYTPRNYSMDHIIPLGMGGKDDMRNIHLLCWECDSKKNKEDIKTIWESRKIIKEHHKEIKGERE